MKHLDRDLKKLTEQIQDLGRRVETALEKSIQAYLARDMVTARNVVEGDKAIDLLEVDVEEDCLKILALHQPVAADLRYVVTVLKVNNDLERIGDLAANVAGRTIALADLGEAQAPTTLLLMSRISLDMVQKSLQALVKPDTSLAKQVLEEDQRLDELHRRNMREFIQAMADEPGRVPLVSQHLSVSRYLERIGDQATNIAEDVIFLVDGEVVRHRESI